MPYVKKELDKLQDHVSDFGWELNSVEFDLDMLPDIEEPSEMELAEADEVALSYAISAYFRNHFIGYDNKGEPKWNIGKKKQALLRKFS